MNAIITRAALTLLFVAAFAPTGAAALSLEASLARDIAAAVRVHEQLSSAAEVKVTNVRLLGAKTNAKLVRVELPAKGRLGGVTTARVTLRKRDGASDERWATARVSVRVPTVVAVRRIHRGQRITREDVKVELRKPRGSGDGVPLTEVLGRVTRRSLGVGDAVARAGLRLPPVVAAGDSVDVELAGEGFRIRTVGRAMARGAVGDRVRVRIEATGKIVHGHVIGPRKVEVHQ